MKGSGSLGVALRSWRDRLAPADAGLAAPRHASERRRAVGLRREELALLAGVSVDYITRLEQGRSVSPSAPILFGLARALQLSDAEREHLFLLAGHPAPMERRGSALTSSMKALLDQMDGVAAGAYDVSWTLVAWNRTWAALSGDPSSLRGRDRNVAWLHFTDNAGMVTQTDDQRANLEAAMVSDLRAASIRYPDDTELHSLVADLCAASTRFADLWDSYVVAVHTMNRKTFHHPVVGALLMDCHVLMVPDSDIRIVTHTATPDGDTAAKLKRLRSAAIC
ncbi:helix-turn-helix transcriptional regulator [Streptomyces sp. NPDC059743]|uniref:helix-turn-helix transcriptional regulator n=1 Tax=Streptomyces sp. NPDC059743 TaxID=3346928 RepID=UPI00364B39AE